MGWGDFGSNGSVHWAIAYEANGQKNTPDHYDYDNDVKHPQNPAAGDKRPPIGSSAGKKHAGYFLVTLRYPDSAAALAAHKAATPSGDTIEIRVPVKPWQDVVNGPDPDRKKWEINVDW